MMSINFCLLRSVLVKNDYKEITKNNQLNRSHANDFHGSHVLIMFEMITVKINCE